jgi:selenocysteine-specific elongation factor
MSGDANETRFYTVGTAGHVDHGKSTLVKALTGEDPDRLPEEKARGMTIDLGFVHADLGDGVAVTFIDVPGHERFLKTAIAGVAGIDLALFVIAADEGVMPQTREHLAILKHVGVRRGIVALTKIDMVEEDWLALVTEDVRAFFRGSFLAAAPIIAVSSTTGIGLEQLRTAIKTALADVTFVEPTGPFRMAIDRVFTLRGFGTIVGGTVAAGKVRAKDELEIQPLGRKVRVRGIQSRHAEVTVATPGMRAALNIAGVEQDEVKRGFEIAAPGLLSPTRRLDLALTLDQGPLAHRAPVRFNKGTAESLGRILLLDAAEGESGRRHFAQIILDDPVVASRYEPFVIRDPSTMRLVGGGKILDVFPTPHRRQAWVVEELAKIEAAEHDPAALLQTLFTRAKGPRRAYRASELAAATGLTPDALGTYLTRLLAEGTAAVVGQDYIPGKDYAALQQIALSVIRTALERDPLRDAVSRDEVRTRLPYGLSPEGCAALLEGLTAAGQLETSGGGFRIAGFKSELTLAHHEALSVIEGLFAVNPPLRGRDEVEELLATYAEGTTMLKYALARGKLVLLPENLIASPSYVDAQKQALVSYLTTHETTRAAEYKDVVNLSRKQATALLDYFQLAGVTIREAGTHRLAPKYRPAAEA